MITYAHGMFEWISWFISLWSVFALYVHGVWFASDVLVLFAANFLSIESTLISVANEHRERDLDEYGPEGPPPPATKRAWYAGVIVVGTVAAVLSAIIARWFIVAISVLSVALMVASAFQVFRRRDLNVEITVDRFRRSQWFRFAHTVVNVTILTSILSSGVLFS